MDINTIKNKIKDYGIKINPITTLDKIKNFEKEYTISLPQELVMFYTQITNGCEMFDGFNLKSLEQLNFDAEKIKNEFVFTEPWIWEDESDISEDLYKNIEMGNIELIDIGCSQSWHIIINGKEKGSMWLFTDVGIQPCNPKINFSALKGKYFSHKKTLQISENMIE